MYQNDALHQKIEETILKKDDLEEELKEKSEEYEYVKNKFEERKREWDRKQQEIEYNAK